MKKRLRLLSEELLRLPLCGKMPKAVKRRLTSSFAIFLQKNGGWKILSSPAILTGFLRLKTQNFAVKLNCKNRFTFIQKNSEYLELMEPGGKVLSLRNLIFSPRNLIFSTHLLDLLAKQCAWEDIHLYLYGVFFR